MAYRWLKISVFLIVFYQIFWMQAFGAISGALVILYLILDISLFIYMKNSQGGLFNHINRPCIIMIIFGVIMFLSGLIYSTFELHNTMIYVNEAKNCLEYILLFIAVYYCVKNEEKLSFPLTCIFVTEVFFAVKLQISGTEIAGRLVISSTGNANDTAINMFLGIASGLTLMYLNKNKGFQIICLIFSFLAINNIILSGSKKGFIALLIFGLLFFLLVYIPNWVNMSFLKKAFGVVSIAILIYLLESFLLDTFNNSILFERLLMAEKGQSEDYIRIELMREGFELFKKAPIFGIGYNNFRYLSRFGIYSHSTYFEVLSCTGIVGSFLYFGTWIIIFVGAIKYYLKSLINKNKRLIILMGFIITIIGCEFFLGTGTITLYDPLWYVLFGAFAACLGIGEKYAIKNHD